MPTKVVLCDTPDGLAQLQYVLIRSGAALEIETVTDGLRAVEVSARTRPELVVAGVESESLSVAELVRRLLAITPETKVICWADASPTVAAEMLQAGAAAYVSKDEGPDAVFRAMRAVHAGPVALSPRVAGDIATRLLDEERRVATLETTVAEVTAQLESMTTAKADFLANVSHELRTPVTVAKGIAYVLKNRGLPEEEEQEFIGQLEASLEKLAMLIEEMLIVADLDRGTLSLEVSEIDLAPLLRQVAAEISRQFPAVTLEREIPETLRGSADPMRFIEIVRQLLDNACRYSPEDEAVQLKGRPMDEGVVVSVTDHGEGMARQTASRAFEEPFSAGEDILRKERAGAGVGLHMARQLVVQHGGILWADPLPSGGTRVSFVIPAHQGDRVSRPPDPGSGPLEELHALAGSASEPAAGPTPPASAGTWSQPSTNASSS
ncbi:MAG: ATP-binding protein [Actinomycetota bacterium]